MVKTREFQVSEGMQGTRQELDDRQHQAGGTTLHRGSITFFWRLGSAQDIGGQDIGGKMLGIQSSEASLPRPDTAATRLKICLIEVLA